MPKETLWVFDPNITRNSPAGSCLLTLLEAARERFELEIYANQCSLAPFHRLRTLRRPVLVENIVFFLRACIAYGRIRKSARGLTISTQGVVPFCDICYVHNPHKLFLEHYRQHIGGGFFTRTARILNYRWIEWMEAMAFRRARVIAVPSQGLAEELKQSYGTQMEGKLRVIPNPVDFKAFARPKEFVAGVKRAISFVFCALGNFEWKGLGLVLDAMKGVPAELTVVGGNVLEVRQFRKRALELGIGARVHFSGFLEDIRPFLWRADVFVFPSLHESFGLVCLQAAAAGLALITTRLYALEEIVKPGVSGWIVERDADQIREVMAAAMKHRERTVEMGRQAQLLARGFDKEAFQQRWLNLLESAGTMAK